MIIDFPLNKNDTINKTFHAKKTDTKSGKTLITFKSKDQKMAIDAAIKRAQKQCW